MQTLAVFHSSPPENSPFFGPQKEKDLGSSVLSFFQGILLLNFGGVGEILPKRGH